MLSDSPCLILDGDTQQSWPTSRRRSLSHHTMVQDSQLRAAGSYSRLSCILYIEGLHLAVALLAASCRQQGGIHMQGPRAVRVTRAL